MPNVYLISGLGADRRAYRFIDLPGYHQVHLDWIEPSKDETLGDYAERLAHAALQEEQPIIIGTSLGGMMAAELTARHPHVLAIIISSIMMDDERPWIMRLGRFTHFHRWAPLWVISMLKKLSFVWGWWQLRRSPRPMVEEMLDIFAKADAWFTIWAIGACCFWQPRADLDRVIRIHGTADRLFPFHRLSCHCDHVLQGGTHLMVYVRGREMSRLLLDALQGLRTGVVHPMGDVSPAP
jgi:pimeloyl-ACP methyl ester carboxylesterase